MKRKQSKIIQESRADNALTVGHDNIRSLMHPIDFVADALSTYGLDLLAISETWLHKNAHLISFT